MELEIIASRYHGALAVGHLFAVYYNVKRKNWIDAAIHAAFVLYDGGSAIRHNKEATWQKAKEQR